MNKNLKSFLVLIIGGVIGACILVAAEALMKVVGVNNQFGFSLMKALVISFGLSLYFVYYKTTVTSNKKKWDKQMLFRVTLSVVIITTIDLILN